MKVFVIGLECQPHRGSEPSIAWHWAQAYERLGYDVTVVTHSSQRRHVAAHDLPVIFVDSISAEWEPAPAATSRHLARTVIEVGVWSRRVHRLLAGLVAPDDLVHHVSWGSIRVKSPVAGLPCRTLWGPLGGGHLSPWSWALDPRSGSVFEAVRNLTVLAVRARARARRTAAGIDAVLATNLETAQLARAAATGQVGLELADGLTSLPIPRPRADASVRSEFRLLWAGRVVRSKRLDLAIEMMAELRTKGHAIRLTVAGDGPDLPRVREVAEKLDVLDVVDFLGWTAHQTMGELYHAADLYVFTSFRDSSFPAVLEAASHGLAAVAVNHQGIRALLPDNAAVKVAPAPVYSLPGRMAEAVADIAAHPQRRGRLSHAARQMAAEQIWSAKARRMLDMLSITPPVDATILPVLPQQRVAVDDAVDRPSTAA